MTNPRGPIQSSAPAECPSEYALDAFVVDGRPADHPLRRHLDACPRCQERMAERERVAQEFRESVFPATVEAVTKALVQARPQPAVEPEGFWTALREFLGGAPLRIAAAAGAVGVILLVVWLAWLRPGQPLQEDGYTGIKGAIGLEVWAKRGAQSFQVEPGMVLLPGDAIRFKPAMATQGFLMILSVEQGGRINVYYPLGGTQAERVQPSHEPLPGSVVLDESRGNERIFALFSPSREFGLAEVRPAVEAAFNQGATPITLEKLPLDLDQVSLLVAKGVF